MEIPHEALKVGESLQNSFPEFNNRLPRDVHCDKSQRSDQSTKSSNRSNRMAGSGSFRAYFAFWLLSTDVIGHLIEKEFIRSRFRRPRIGVLRTDDPLENDFQRIKKGCEFGPRTWVKGLQTYNLSAESVVYSESISNFDVLVNPYGETYLESDLSNMRTLKDIMRFVSDGGFFLSMGGLGFFYMYDPKKNIEGLTGPMFEFYIGGSYDVETQGVVGRSKPSLILEPRPHPNATSLVDSWLFRNLGLRTTLRPETTRTIQPAHKEFANLLQANTTVQEFRSVERCESSDNELIPVFRAQYQNFPTERIHECYPIAAIRHGLGYFVICGMVVNKQEHKNLVENIIAKICEILANRGRLDYIESG